MKTFPASFTTEKNRIDGAAPLWILKIRANSIDYYLSTVAVAITDWAITTKAWVKEFGSLSEGVTGLLEEFRISDFSATCLADPDAVPNIITLADSYNLEKEPASLYLWFADATDPPQEVFRGYIRDYPISEGDTICRLELQDESVKWQETYVGRKLSLVDYPNADPDDVGKVIPIPFGAVSQVPALCVEAGIITTLTADITAAATSITLSTAAGLSGKDITIDQEQLHVSSIAGNTATVTRGQNGTVAGKHNKGAQVVEKKSTPLVYLAADLPINSFGQVNAFINDRLIDVTDSCALYTGQTGSEHASYPGKAVVTIADFVAIKKQVQLSTAGSGLSVDTGSHSHSLDKTFSEVCTASLPVDTNPIGTTIKYYNLSFPASSGTRVEVIYEITVNCAWIDSLAFSVDGYGQVWSYSNVGSRSINIIVAMGNRTKTGNGVTLSIVGLNNVSQQATIMSAKRTITISDAATVSEPAAGVALVGNSVADTIVGSSLYIDMTRAVTDPGDVFPELLAWGGVTSFNMLGSLPAAYSFNFVINEYRRLPDWLHDLAWQCRSWLRHSCGTATLTVRDTVPAAVKTLTTCRIAGGKRLSSRAKTAYSEVINTITLLYGRDWKQARSDRAYTSSVADLDSTSIADFGKQERPELFMLDAVTDPDMAADLLAFYLGWYAARHWLHDVETDYRNCELEFADPVAVGFAKNINAIVLSAEISPGGDILKLKLIQ